MKSKKLLNSLLCGFLIAGMGTINAMEDAQERHIIASALKPTWYSKYWPVTVAAHMAAGYAFSRFLEPKTMIEDMSVVTAGIAPLCVWSAKATKINAAIKNAKEENNLLLAQRLESFNKKNMIYSWTNFGCLVAFGIFNKSAAFPMVLAGSLAASLLVEHWGTKESSIPE